MQEKHKKKHIRVVTSGGFDPLHIGHVRLFNEAKKLGDELIVILNNDNWLKQKKGFVFMPETERKEIIESLAAVDKVILSHHKPHPVDMSVTKDLGKLKPDIFAQGGDRKPSSLPIPGSEIAYCTDNDCTVVYNLGKGGKVESSSRLAMNFMNDVIHLGTCPCGSKLKFKNCGLKQTKTHQDNLKKMLNKI